VQQNVVPFCDNDRETQIVLFAAEILETSTVSGDRYSAAKNILENDRVLVEITSIIGYYTFCAYTLNVFQIPSKKL
jgi:alkylhydroperoxidase family enzyme